MDYIKLLRKYFPDEDKFQIIYQHSLQVKDKALELAKNVPELNLDLKFIEEAAMLHDIGVSVTKNEDIGGSGTESYIKHGVAGREILEKEGFPKHALVCERHIGTGLTVKDIQDQKLDVPSRDMSPQSNEEIVISFADNFFSKTVQGEISLEKIKQKLVGFGTHKPLIIDSWTKKFKLKH